MTRSAKNDDRVLVKQASSIDYLDSVATMSLVLDKAIEEAFILEGVIPAHVHDEIIGKHALPEGDSLCWVLRVALLH